MWDFVNVHVAGISLSEWADVLESKIFSDLKVLANKTIGFVWILDASSDVFLFKSD